ncbi:MAG: hypothetical protein U0235_17410 [Polyangiaceae bacterium]
MTLALGALGCGIVEEPVSHRTSSLQAVQAPNGYYHKPSASAFRLGRAVEQRSQFGLEKTIGSEGVFAVHAGTSAAIAIPNADAPCLSAPPLLPADAHSERVRKYFVDRGVSPAEIRSVNVTTEMAGGGYVGTSGTPPRLVRYNSGLVRILEGVPVVDSVAWAAFTAADEVCKEEVDWPEIPRAVIDDAHQLQQVLAEPTRRAALQAKLPTASKLGEVVIRHSRWSSPNSQTTVAFASYDVADNGSVRHFDVAGGELRLPAELPSTQAPSRR